MGKFLAEGVLEVKVLDGCEVTAETDLCGGSGGCIPQLRRLALQYLNFTPVPLSNFLH
jgi:hypothetical protein